MHLFGPFSASAIAVCTCRHDQHRKSSETGTSPRLAITNVTFRRPRRTRSSRVTKHVNKKTPHVKKRLPEVARLAKVKRALLV
jgi:hypothetical protein